MSSERLQKYLARAGVASRRHAEELITSGKVQVNNQTVTVLGTKVEPGKDLVTVNGRLVSPPDSPMYFVLYKPPAVVTTLEDPQGRRSIADFAQEPGRRLFPVGRLDYDAEGALLLTDDGELAHQLMHPSYQVPRTYLAKVKGEPTEATLEKLRGGVRLEDGMAQPKVAEVVEKAEKNTWLKIVVTEGRPHLIKRLCAAIGHPVVRLYRPDYAGISAEGLQPGERRALKPEEVQLLKDVASGKVQPQDRMARLPPRRHGRAGVELDDAPEMGGKLFRGAAHPAEDDVPSEPRRDAKPAPKERAGGFERPQRGGGKFADRPARGGDRPSRGEDRPARAGAGDRPSRDRGERAERPFRGGFGAGAERPARGGAFKERTERPFRAGFGGDKPARGGAGERPGRGGGFGDRAERPARGGGFGDRAERPARGGGFGDRSERPARAGGFGGRSERPARGSGFGDRAERPARGGGFGGRSERPARSGGFGDRAERPARGGGFGDRAERPARGGGFGDRAERPARSGGFGSGAGGRFGDRPKFGAKPKGAGRFGALPRGDRAERGGGSDRPPRGGGSDRPPRGGGDRPRGGGGGGARRTRSWKPHGDKE